MKKLISIEELAMALLAVLGLYQLQAPWWCYLLLLLGPDISMAGYLVNNRIGAALYNFFHHKGFAIILFAAGFLMHLEALMITGLILFGHAALDRMLGYGLKLNKGFNYTHLGLIGKKKYEGR
ncbi:hypothetical protein A8C56_09015 [Niabella ginsenosidivorans]|uniref:DUF4260 domain-containing protein n=1 Tax=Niabella ginsenosidivorans TaxID=1176587 RepID=A0A1A9I337_9BACT|nr:DUF4260 domain-containing protein [Niabella ginsenosidivorans]ANH81101.1 hypothetical protein A8C56_09015 [Niabella ginsenosidivorans]